MFHVVVCDDEKIFREELTAWLQRYQEENQVSFCIKEFHEGKELADHMPSQMDILFLDIKMKTMDGIKVAETVRALNEGVSIIFLTAVAEYALEGYKVNAFDYLIKPVSYEKLTKVLTKTLKMIDRRKTRFLTVRNHDIWYRVALGDIVFVETLNRHCVIHTVCGFYVSTKKMRDLEKELPEDNFFRCNSGYIVNFDHIEKVVRSDIYLRNNEIITASRSRRKQFIDRLAEYWGEEM